MDNKMNEMLQKALKEAEEKGIGIEEAVQKFMTEYNMGLLDNVPNTPLDDAYELLDKAYQSKTKKQAKKYAEDALAICPDFLDAKIFLIDMEKSCDKKLELLNKAIKEEKEKLIKENFFEKDCIGHFYGIFETRPYIRALYQKTMVLTEMGKMRLAIRNCEEIIRLNESDNTGTRYMLMALYSYLEDEKSLLKLYKKYNEDSLETLVPLMIYYYKQNDYEKAKEYLKLIKKENKNFIDFYIGKMKDENEVLNGYYSLGSASEVIMYFNNYGFLLLSVPSLKEFILKNK